MKYNSIEEALGYLFFSEHRYRAGLHNLELLAVFMFDHSMSVETLVKEYPEFFKENGK